MSSIKKFCKNQYLEIFIAQMDIKLKYRRTIIGPLWIVLTTSIFVLFLTFLWSEVFNIDYEEYLVFFSTGYVIWIFLSQSVSEATIGYSRESNVIKNMRIDLDIFSGRVLFKNIFIFFHNCLFLIPLLIFFGDISFQGILLSLLSLLLLSIILKQLICITQLLTTLFNDLAHFINLSINLIFFISPILWKPELISKSYIYDYNIVYILVELLRQPLIKNTINLSYLTSSLIFLFILMFIKYLLQKKYNNLISKII